MQTENLRINQSKSITQSDDFLSISDMDESSEELELNINKYLKQGQKAYEVLKYAENCEKQNQISYILPLSTTIPKKIIFIILNIITLGIINIFIEWFPKIILYIHYSVTDLYSATHFGIFSKIDKARFILGNFEGSSFLLIFFLIKFKFSFTFPPFFLRITNLIIFVSISSSS